MNLYFVIVEQGLSSDMCIGLRLVLIYGIARA